MVPGLAVAYSRAIDLIFSAGQPLRCPAHDAANTSHEMRASFGSGPGFPVPGLGTIPLRADNLFFSTPYLPAIFQKFRNKLDAAGNGKSYVAIPADNRLKGVSLYCAYVTYDTSLRAVSNAGKRPMRDLVGNRDLLALLPPIRDRTVELHGEIWRHERIFAEIESGIEIQIGWIGGIPEVIRAG